MNIVDGQVPHCKLQLLIPGRVAVGKNVEAENVRGQAGRKGLVPLLPEGEGQKKGSEKKEGGYGQWPADTFSPRERTAP